MPKATPSGDSGGREREMLWELVRLELACWPRGSMKHDVLARGCVTECATELVCRPGALEGRCSFILPVSCNNFPLYNERGG
eukprot:scaffold82403_cov34-Phaeocystis_antarctica.AAC.1